MKCDICSRAFVNNERFKYYYYYAYLYKISKDTLLSYENHASNRLHYNSPDNLGLYLCFNCDNNKLKVEIIEIPKHLPKEQYKRFALTILRKGRNDRQTI